MAAESEIIFDFLSLYVQTVSDQKFLVAADLHVQVEDETEQHFYFLHSLLAHRQNDPF